VVAVVFGQRRPNAYVLLLRLCGGEWMPRPQSLTILALIFCVNLGLPTLSALDPHRRLTQYTRSVWSEEDGLPEDTIRSITQTTDGYLWLATEEGLTRFDGYDFVTFTKNNSALPSNSIRQLTAGRDGMLWIGTSVGLVGYRSGRFTTFTIKDGLPDNVITSLFEDHNGTLWIATGSHLSRLENNRITNVSAERLLPIQAVRAICEDHQGALWLVGAGGLIKLEDGKFLPVLGSKELDGNRIAAMSSDRENNLWIAGTKGVISRAPNGELRRFDLQNRSFDNLVEALWADRGGNIWLGANGKLSRLENDRFVSSSFAGENHEGWVRCLFEDREGNLWIGRNNGLNRLRDGQFTLYGRTEGFPSDEPQAVYQDRGGDIWVGFLDGGLVAMHQGKVRIYSTADGLPSNGIFAIHESRDRGILLSTREGLSWLHAGRFSNYILPEPLGHVAVYDALEDQRGQIWAAGPGGVYLMTGKTVHHVIRRDALLNGGAAVLSEGLDGSIWVGTYGDGLWQIRDGKARQFNSGDRVRALYQDPDGTLWIGTFGDGLSSFRNGVFFRYAAKQGLLSDNISHIEDDGNGSLWLSTPRGICRVAKRQLAELAAGGIRTLTPVIYGLEEGLRSAQSAPGYSIGGGGARTQDGRLWFTTTRGLAVLDTTRVNAYGEVSPPPIVQLIGATADGQGMDLDRPAQLKPGTGHVQFRYIGIHLSAPERVSYSYKLEGMDRDWIPGDSRSVDYNQLGHGHYRFLVRATVLGQSSEAAFGLEVLPHFYERQYFRWICLFSGSAAIYGLYQLRLQQIRSRFSSVLEERARMAREIHDTLAQGFVGISRQLDATAKRIDGDDNIGHQHLELAQKMVRHCLTEARRSVIDLRASPLEDGDLFLALTTATREWTTGKAIPIEIDVAGTLHKLPEDVAHNMLRISQEAVANALAHGDASRIWIHLRMESGRLFLTVKDNGQGFDLGSAFTSHRGHFGLLGMRERAERLGGTLDFSSDFGQGTEVKVSIPLAAPAPWGAARVRRHAGLTNTT
jgi:signal transduction histidine kinase/ligand-binding sensor domain-containing protein